MALFDLLFPTFVFSQYLTELSVGSLLVSGPLGQVLCKISYYFQNASTAVSIQSLVMTTVDRFVAMVFPLRTALISYQLCPFLILASWIVEMAETSPNLFIFKLVKYPETLMCMPRWKETFGRSSSVADYVPALYVVIYYVPVVLLIVLYSIIPFKLKSQRDSRQTIGQN